MRRYSTTYDSGPMVVNRESPVCLSVALLQIDTRKSPNKRRDGGGTYCCPDTSPSMLAIAAKYYYYARS